MEKELKQILNVLKQPEIAPDFTRIFINFSMGKNHAVIEWKIVGDDAVINKIYGDFKALTTYDADKCIGLSIKRFVDEQEQANVANVIKHTLEVGFTAKKTAIFTETGELKYISGIIYRHDKNTLIELMFNPVGIEL